jgi:hypothetical protein
MPPKKRKIPPHLMERVNHGLVLQLEDHIPFVTLGGGSKDVGKTKKARALEATDTFGKYTDRIKELEVNDRINQCFVLYSEAFDIDIITGPTGFNSRKSHRRLEADQLRRRV